MLMLAMPILVRRKNNMVFDLLYNRFPEKAQRFIQILTLVLIGAFGVRIPVSWLMSRLQPPSLFRISLATPASTFVQILLFAAFLWWTLRRERGAEVRQE